MSIDRFARIALLRLRSLFRRDVVEQELDEELAYHVEMQTADYIQRGLSPRDARQAALRSLGNVGYHKEEVRDTRGTRWLEDFAGDVRFALRSLGRARGFAATVILTLALGIGANTAMFTLLRGTLLRPLPNRDGDRLVYVRQEAVAAKQHDLGFSVPEVSDYRASNKTLSSIAEWSQGLPFILSESDGRPARVNAAVVTGNYFDVLGLSPVLGRLTGPTDDGAAAPSVAVLSFRYWMEHFGGNANVIGRKLQLNGVLSTVIGVVQAAPDYPQPTDLFINTVTSPHHLSATMVTLRTHRMSQLFARLAPNATAEEAQRDLGSIASRMFREHPESYQKAAQFDVVVAPLRAVMNERASLMFWLLMGAAAFVLLIACANVANLTLMRGVGREREILVRAALGAASGRLRRLLIAENLTLALIGGALGVLVAFAGTKLLIGFAAQFSARAHEIRIDGMVLTVGVLTSVIAAIALSFAPRVGGQQALAESLAPTGGGHRMTLGRGRQRVQRSLVVAQIAVCMVLLTGAGLLGRTLTKLLSVDSGVRADHVLAMDLPLGDIIKEIMKQPENLARYERVRERVAAIPGVQVAALGTSMPLRSSIISMDVQAEGRPTAPNQLIPSGSFKMVDPRYFTAAGIPLLRGRAFASTDVRESGDVVILSSSLATRLFGNDDAVGRRVQFPPTAMLKMTPFTDNWRTVVGVVGDTRDNGLDGDLTPTIYAPFAQEIIINGSLVVRTSSDPTVVQPMIVRAVREVVPNQLIDHVATIEQVRDQSVVPRRLNAMFIASFSALAFLITMVGIAGMLAFSVSSRTAEIGIRMSLGADASRVRRMVLGEGGALLALGLVIGVSGALFAARLLRGLLFGITPHDPATLGGVAFVVIGVGLAACWLPAARAARVDPATALRAE